MIPTYRVKVKADVIDNAVVADSHRCMIADAIQQKFKWAKYIMVDLQSVRFSNTHTGRRFIYLTPPEAQKAILDFDRGNPVAPFTLNLMQGYERQMRVRAPGYTPQTPRRKYKRGRAAARVMPSRHREFGLRKLVKTGKAAAAK